MRILIPTCDRYRDAVPLALKCLDARWPNHPQVTVVYTETAPEVTGVTLVRLGRDRGWVGNLSAYFGTAFARETDSVLLWLDDYMLVDFNAAVWARAVAALKDAALVRLVPTPGPTLDWRGDDLVGAIDKRADYSLSLQATLWRAADLHRVIHHLRGAGCASAWDVELRGSQLAAGWDDVGPFLGTRQCAVSYDNYYRRGKVVAAVAERLERDDES